MEDFITYELAVKLKEKGFRKPCIAHYTCLDKNELKFNITTDCIRGSNFKVLNNDYKIFTDVPTISQVLKWLIEEKEIFIRVTLSYDYSTDADGEQVDRWTFWLFEVFSVGSGSLIYTEEISEYDSYELAAIAGIEYVIDNNLI